MVCTGSLKTYGRTSARSEKNKGTFDGVLNITLCYRKYGHQAFENKEEEETIQLFLMECQTFKRQKLLPLGKPCFKELVDGLK